ncbi:PepSY domain-containing protein [Azospirillum sp. RWY-5-1]|uniref:PepSY domain-containing protein n=1 Tax=Azospirillum oleiclasticum TaxID=2735135 RepID=A0ABX2TI66_9PROT|nr:PepSY-associated TM helix domain-containing protein [Azospirillum oleiclasticum]NYZ16502.1 PepSY domain-containing protein [Azospirillum oleiclasticum]NYZ24029.1 PepSY domain-containing protein [Azospirillum oleiclasticum]
MRAFWTLLHRWFGLGAAVFLFIAGATGAVISWDHELDDLLNPHLTHVAGTGQALPSLELARRVEERDPRVRATFIPLAVEPGESLSLFVWPRVDPATGRLFEPGYNQVFLDPATGEELGRREWGAAWPITTETFISFLYKLHYSLHIPEIAGIDDWGLWFMGIVAAGWTIDCFVGAYLTLPARRRRGEGEVPRGWWRRWAPAWKIRTDGSAYRINFDIHRAFGLWTWAMLFILAFTAFTLAYYREVFMPAMQLVSSVTPSPFDTRTPTPLHEPMEPGIDFPGIIGRAQAEAARRGWEEPVGSVFFSPNYGLYGVNFHHPGDDHGAAGVGPARLYFDSTDGRYLGDRQPWVGTMADLFVQAQFPLHSGRILGVPGRILVSLMGVVVAALSVTGVVIWARKRRARLSRDIRRGAGAAHHPVAAE